MGNKLVFDYFFGKESEMFSFYRIPRMLIKDPNFSHLSCEAKLLYGLMLDRMALSQRNGWHDDDNRTYIIYTIDEAAADLNCGRGKAIRVMAELDSTSGIGLIEKIRRGLGKPDIIYVKNFVGVVAEQARETSDEFAEVPKSNFKKSQNQICRSSKIELQEVPEKDFKKSQDKTSRSSNMTPQEVSLWDSNYTYKSNTYENYTNLINPSDDSNRALSCKADVMDEMENIRVYIKSNIDYDELVERHRTSKASIDEIVELVVETIAMKTETIRIKGLDMPYEVVKSRFEKLDSVIIEYVLESVSNNTTKVRNIKNYLLTVLFNAPTTCNNYYVTEVNHDLYGKS